MFSECYLYSPVADEGSVDIFMYREFSLIFLFSTLRGFKKNLLDLYHPGHFGEIQDGRQYGRQI